MKNNFKAFVLILCGMFFMFSVDKILNLLFALLYGVAFMLVLGSFLYIDSKKISDIKIICFHAVGVILLWIANLLLITEFSIAILLSVSLSIATCSIFHPLGKHWGRFKRDKQRQGTVLCLDKLFSKKGR